MVAYIKTIRDIIALLMLTTSSIQALQIIKRNLTSEILARLVAKVPPTVIEDLVDLAPTVIGAQYPHQRAPHQPDHNDPISPSTFLIIIVLFSNGTLPTALRAATPHP